MLFVCCYFADHLPSRKMFGLFGKPPVPPPPAPGSLAWLGVKTTNDDLFDLLLIKNPAVIIAWLLIAVAPRWKGSHIVAQSVGVAYAVLYVALFIDGVYNPIDFKVRRPAWMPPFHPSQAR